MVSPPREWIRYVRAFFIACLLFILCLLMHITGRVADLVHRSRPPKPTCLSAISTGMQHNIDMYMMFFYRVRLYIYLCRHHVTSWRHDVDIMLTWCRHHVDMMSSSCWHDVTSLCHVDMMSTSCWHDVDVMLTWCYIIMSCWHDVDVMLTSCWHDVTSLCLESWF